MTEFYLRPVIKWRKQLCESTAVDSVSLEDGELTPGQVQRWETRVIHLNVSGSSGSAAKKPPAPPTSEAEPSKDSQDQKPIFSDNYLKEEFPNHYPARSEEKPARPQHPATQLQTFMNKLGQEGWELVGVFPVGQLTMVFFRRPLPPEAKPPAAEVSPATSAPPPASPEVPSHDDVLQQILQRLNALELRQSQSLAAPQPASGPLKEPHVLTEYEREQLKTTPMISTADAARSLGLRSPASLLNYGARHGYPIGLVKTSINGFHAVYCGTQTRAAGGKPIRLWQVVSHAALLNI